MSMSSSLFRLHVILENGISSIIWIISIRLVSEKDFFFSSPEEKLNRICLDGVVLVDPEYVKDRKVYASVLAGRKD